MPSITRSLSQFTCFDAVARNLSFAAGARELGMAPSSVAKSIARLEIQIGMKLFRRTTRSVSLTPEGEQLFKRTSRILEELASLDTYASKQPGEPEGELRISAPVGYGGAWFYFAPLEGPWSRISTRSLDDFSISEDQLVSKVEPWADLPPVGGTVMDANGDLYFSDLADCSIKRRAPDGKITTIVTDKRLHWVDAPTIDEQHRIWMPVPQMDRVAIFQGGSSAVQWPVYLLRINLPTESSSPATQ